MNGLQKYPHLAARVFNTPLLIHPQKLDAIIAGLGSRLLGSGPLTINAVGMNMLPSYELLAKEFNKTFSSARASLDAMAADGAQLLPADLFSTRKGRYASDERGYQVVDGVAVININGPLLHRSRFDMADSSYMLGYNDIAADVEDAMSHPDVHAVLKVWASPGGEADGAFEFSDRMAALRGKKPMISIADGLAASAAYLGASSSDEIIVTSTGYVGSIGVVMRHVDFSQALAADGIKVTHIYAGAHKVDGNPYEPLPDAVRADYQAEIDGLMTMFVETVAKNTGLDPTAIRKTQAATFRGVSAVAVGLASRLGTTDQIISELASQRSRSYPSGQTARATANQGDSMSGNTNPGGQTTASTATTPTAAFSQSDIDRARAAGVAEGSKAERERVGSILTHEKAGANMALAVQCVNSGLTAEQAGAILGIAPAKAVATTAATSNNAFAAAMAATGNPQVSGVEASAEAGNEEAALAGQILAAFSLGGKASA